MLETNDNTKMHVVAWESDDNIPNSFGTIHILSNIITGTTSWSNRTYGHAMHATQAWRDDRLFHVREVFTLGNCVDRVNKNQIITNQKSKWEMAELCSSGIREIFLQTNNFIRQTGTQYTRKIWLLCKRSLTIDLAPTPFLTGVCWQISKHCFTRDFPARRYVCMS